MNVANHDTYLESKVLTAPPHRLHLMLVEGALRFGRQAVEAFEGGDLPAAEVPLLRILDILGELLAGARQRNAPLNEQIAEFYLYLFGTIADAKVNSDRAKLDEAIALLEYERQTWRMLCEKLGSADRSSSPAASQQTRPSPILRISGAAPPAAASRLSFEA